MWAVYKGAGSFTSAYKVFMLSVIFNPAAGKQNNKFYLILLLNYQERRKLRNSALCAILTA